MDIDLSFITAFFSDAYEAIKFQIDFIQNGLYDFFVEWYALFIETMTIWAINWTLFTVQFAWDIAQQILTDLNISSVLNDAFSSLDSPTTFYLTALRIPEALNNILSGLVAGFSMRFIPR